MRRTVSGILLLFAMLLVPHLVFAGPPSVPVPEAKPAAQVPALKVEQPAASVQLAAEIPEVTGVRWANHIDAVTGMKRLRLVIEVTKPIKTEAMMVGTPTPKLVITLQGTAAGKLAEGMGLDGSIAEQVSAYMSGGNTRMLVDVPLMLEDSD